MKIINLKSANVKRLVAVEITPDGNLVVIGGRNGMGKSSILDSILYALAGKRDIPEKPIRNGEDRAEIEIRLEACPERGIMHDLIVRRTFTAAGETYLDIRAATDAANALHSTYKSPQSLLDGLTGRVGFDPLAFMRLKPREQAEQLSAVVGLDFTKLDQDRKDLYDERHAVNRNLASAKHDAEKMPSHFGATPVDTAELLAELNRRREANARVTDMEAAAQAAQDELACRRSARHDADAEVERLRKELADAEAYAAECAIGEAAAAKMAQEAAERAAGAARADEAEIEAKIAAAGETNAKVADNKRRDAALSRVAELEAESKGLTEAIERIDAEKAKAMAEAAWPIAGLGFSESGVTLNGLPFEQASSSEQLTVSVAVGAALNPTLPVFMIRDGSLLDADSLRTVGELAEKYGCQVWVERVSEGEECSVVIADGAVARRREAVAAQ